MLRTITLLGSSSGRNAGDAALISGIMDSVDSACGTPLQYEIPTIRPRYVAEIYGPRAKPISMLPWALSVKMLGVPTYRSVMSTDLSLVFDAILFDRSLYNPLFNFMSSVYLMLPRAKKAGKLMGFYNVGAGPVNTKLGRRMLRELSDMMDFITVRDEGSYNVLREIGVKNPRVLIGADAALNVRACPEERTLDILGKLGLDAKQEILGVNVNAYLDTWAGPGGPKIGREGFIAAYAAALNRVLRTLQTPLLFVATHPMDIPITQAIMARVKSPAPVRMIANREYNHFEIKGVLGKLALLSGMRLHSSILASSELTPVLGLVFQPKVEHYFKTVGLPEFTIKFDNFSEELLSARILDAWDKKAEIKARLRLNIPVLQRQAHKAGELVAALHRGEDLDLVFKRLKGG